MSFIRFENIQKAYNGKCVLDSISMDINQGEFITLLGPSGCGKTTLLRCLAGLTKVDGGKIFIDSVDMTDASPNERHISMIFQQYSLFPNMTVLKTSHLA